MKVTSEMWPPGFRFHPTDEELVLYYLKRKICNRRIKMNIIAETDVYKWDPEELPGQSLLETGDRQWFFFSPRDRKYPNGARSNRATRQGYWKATGKDRNITCNSRNVGVKKTLVFYKGRAPNGERTDWVMHEYTLDEEELKRCQNMQDYYALYKVFKKSGPGPKNGEQYGAPFKEEEWENDEDLDVKKSIEQEIPAKQCNEVAAIDDVRPVTLDDIEEFIKELADEPSPLEPQISCAYEAPQVIGEEEAQSNLMNPSSKEVMVSEPVGVCNEQASFDFTLSASTNMQLYDASEVTSAPKTCEPALQFYEEDFLEMDDLIDPESTISAAEKPAENLQFDEFDGLSDLDLFHDAAMYLHDLGPVNEELITNVHGINMLNHVDHQFQLPSGVNPAVWQVQPSLVVNQMDHELQPNLVVNQMSHELQPNLTVNQADYRLQTHSFGAEWVGSQPWMQDFDGEHINNQPCMRDLGAEHINNQPWMQDLGTDHVNSQPWMHDQLTNIHTPAVSNQGISYRPSSGLVHQPTNGPIEANQNQNGQEEGGTTSWVSSSLWSFVESIPTTPASASETPLVYRALERMSSFSRLRINAENTNVVSESDGTVTRRQASSNRGFLLFSLFGALCALLWMFMGTIRVLGRSISP